ncbi:hypothetical protein [Staphylothermus hellenicus]|uniref:Uncharacterized protein n=1 Tax=Staphylothermus hellenicus (strain DSM 12710 / JCM 10830 / BK20S6-10-b1 / P8) TaxID=591019 RepID=D7DC18_STAHD|nr:hypothetical protein [Staphylothermus hellenicus]ADI31715.1 hypothetical protein Shell_0590 [Staphylothermus hellenicus DSM 12710]
MSSYIVEKYVVELADSLSYVRSIDGFLVKLGTIVVSLEDDCRNISNCDPAVLLENILMHEKLSRYLSRFSCYLEDIVDAINSDPRHKVLRKYIGVLRGVLERIKCVESPGIQKTTPPALWVKEYREQMRPVKPVHKLSLYFRLKKNTESSLTMILLLSIILYVISLIIYLSK